MRLIITFFVLFFVTLNANAQMIKMIKNDSYGFNLPKYIESETKGGRDIFEIKLIADKNNFPLSSEKQGSIFYKIFESAIQAGIKITFEYPKDYQEALSEFERRTPGNNTQAAFGMDYEKNPYSRNEYIYPAFFENNIYIITSAQNRLDLQNKESLKNYKGIYVKTDHISKVVAKKFASLNMTEVESYTKAYEMLLSEQSDYIAGSYYPSQIEAYMLGIRNYLTYSIAPVWKIPLFIKAKPELKNNPNTKRLEKYLKSPQYKKTREDAFAELIEIYKENTQGVVPPTYINQNIDIDENQKEIEKQSKGE